MNYIVNQAISNRLNAEINVGRLPHALLLAGPEGNGAYALALQVAHRLLGAPAMMARLEHPDLHFSFPVFKKDSKPTPCDAFVRQWRDMVLNTPYFGYKEWMDAIGADNQQLTIYVEESEALLRKLSLKANQGGYRVVIIWLPEKMNAECANKMLKLLEEPPAQTVFLLVSEHPEQMLTTVRSRCQTIEVPPLAEADIQAILTDHYQVDPQMAADISHTSRGNICAALRHISGGDDDEQMLELFKSLMRLSYTRRVREMKKWSEDVAAMGRERQKRFLDYCQRMIRENFIYNFHNPELNYQTKDEEDFSRNFARFINEANVIEISEQLELAMRQIAQNANPRVVFFDLALQIIVLLIKK